MMHPTARLLTLFLLPLLLAGCVRTLDAVSQTPIEPDPGKRSFGAFVDDQKLETLIAVNLRKTGSGLAQANTRVNSFNGVVLLTGEVSSRELRQLAGETARSISKVRQVHNELLVKSNSTFFSRTNDRWLRTKIRTRLLTNRDIESERIKIVVENRNVYLMGLLTREEAQLASELAARVSGVEKVVRVIEYIEPGSQPRQRRT